MNEILILGLVILVGFIGQALFQHTKIPEFLFMILIGLAVGPVLGIVDQAVLIGYAPVIVTITLVIVLLDTGLSLNIFETVRTLGKATRLTITVLILTTIFVGAFMYFMGWQPLHALLIGVISSGTTTIIAASLLPRLRVPEEIRQILIMESVINDVTLLTAVLLIVQVIQLETLDPTQLTTAIVGPVAMAIVLGVIFALLWVNVLWRFYKGEQLTYVFTIGVLFLLYSLVELVGGNGAIAVLVLSLLLGNLPLILATIMGGKLPLMSDLSKSRTGVLMSLADRFHEVLGKIRESQVDFAFFIRNFFFVYLGIIFDPGRINLPLAAICGAILMLMFLSRYISARILAISSPKFKQHSTIITGMVARGFTATFVALLPATVGIEIPQLKELVLIMVLLSTFATILISAIYERRLKPTPETDQSDRTLRGM